MQTSGHALRMDDAATLFRETLHNGFLLLCQCFAIAFISLNYSSLTARLSGQIGMRLPFVATAVTGRSPIANEGHIRDEIHQAKLSLKK